MESVKNPKLNRLAEVLFEKQMKSKEFEEKMGVSHRVVSYWRNNKTQPKIITLFRIAKVLDVPVRDLLANVNPL